MITASREVIQQCTERLGVCRTNTEDAYLIGYRRRTAHLPNGVTGSIIRAIGVVLPKTSIPIQKTAGVGHIG